MIKLPKLFWYSLDSNFILMVEINLIKCEIYIGWVFYLQEIGWLQIPFFSAFFFKLKVNVSSFTYLICNKAWLLNIWCNWWNMDYICLYLSLYQELVFLPMSCFLINPRAKRYFWTCLRMNTGAWRSACLHLHACYSFGKNNSSHRVHTSVHTYVTE